MLIHPHDAACFINERINYVKKNNNLKIKSKRTERGDSGWLFVKYTQIITKQEDGIASRDLDVALTADTE